MSEVWRICLYCLKKANEKYPVEIISFVLMSNHYHMIVRTPDKNIDLFMYEFNKHLANIILRRSSRVSRVFGSRYKWCLIKSQSYLYNCYRYVYQNPLRAGLVSKCENYPYSSLFYLVHNKTFSVDLFDTFGFKDEYALSWINKGVKDEEANAIRAGLKLSLIHI